MLVRGRYTAREASGPDDVARAQALRALAFDIEGPDRDAFDDICTHVLVEEGSTLVACFRLLPMTPDRIEGSYSGQFYDLSRLRDFDGKMMEMGRFCLAPDRRDPDIVRVAWGAVARIVGQTDVRLLFGCSSFHGVVPEVYLDTFALLRRGHLGPSQWLPRVKASCVFPYAHRLHDYQPDVAQGMRMMPPLLRSYLLMGGWVSDHAVVDPGMNTLHVFTALDINAIPPARAARMRALAL